MVLSRQGKKDAVKEFQELMDNSKVVGLLNMERLPCKQLQTIKKELRGTAQIKMSRKRIMKLAVDAATRKDLKYLNIDSLTQPALLFSNKDSFKLFAEIKKRKIPAGAKEGAIVPKEVIIEKGPTDLPPGPAMSEIQKIGLKTKVEGGKILIANSKKVLSPGDTITKDIADVLNKLGIEPLEIGLDVVSTCENGEVFTKDVLDIDQEQYIANLISCAQKAFNLSVNAGIPTKQNIIHILQTAFQKAKNLGLNAEIMDSGIVGDLIAKAANEAKSLESQIHLKVPSNSKESEIKETASQESEPEKVEEKSKEDAKE